MEKLPLIILSSYEKNYIYNKNELLVFMCHNSFIINIVIHSIRNNKRLSNSFGRSHFFEIVKYHIS